ncbi:copper amine oxidase N-terminal domain-containing protein [Caldinitratiruptor microaerophilus]|uniref:Copper amine oxidase-like N-terminal domain-containing protein n=1 Tax=Caldinitratiruptor microaerophilus TaxID=671077 RepID=A0AA35CKR3_9FIRM|nr:copper amine oxidase N-terminal domain-containing protein [Caldinitratiruptor microaerophilus]BDG59322.1 hypothetical protein caldi_04120 [Caldinitratiruptor microaerophilus]
MRRNRRLWAALVALVAVLVGGVASAATPLFRGFRTVRVVLEGREIQADVPGVILEGRTVLPVRALAEALGLKVSWDEATSTVVLERQSPPSGAQEQGPDAGARQASTELAIKTKSTPKGLASPSGVTLTVENVTMNTNLSERLAVPSAMIVMEGTLANAGRAPYDLAQARVTLRSVAPDEAGRIVKGPEVQGVLAQPSGERVAGTLAPGQSIPVRLVFRVPDGSVPVPGELELSFSGAPGEAPVTERVNVTIRCSWPPLKCEIVIVIGKATD